jgi:hypothetical protein
MDVFSRLTLNSAGKRRLLIMMLCSEPIERGDRNHQPHAKRLLQKDQIEACQHRSRDDDEVPDPIRKIFSGVVVTAMASVVVRPMQVS